MNILLISAVVAVSYLIGAIPFGLLIGKCYGVDIRKAGSCNIGATNVTRTVGKWQGKLCFLLDFLKGALPVAAVNLLLPGMIFLAVAAGAAAVVGHMFPVYLKFKGGKGISTGGGMAFALAPYPLLIALASWAVIFLIGRYVSLASIAAATILGILSVVFALTGIGSECARSPISVTLIVIISIVAVVRHRSNMVRLLNGTENRFEKKKQEKAESK